MQEGVSSGAVSERKAARGRLFKWPWKSDKTLALLVVCVQL